MNSATAPSPSTASCWGSRVPRAFCSAVSWSRSISPAPAGARCSSSMCRAVSSSRLRPGASCPRCRVAPARGSISRGSIVLFAGLLCMIGPLLLGHDVGWAPWLWLVMAIGAVILLAFPKLEHAVARAGGMPLIDLSLLADAAFLRGLGAAFFFFFANLSFYLVMTLFMQRGLKIPPLAAGMAFIPLALAFVVASRHSGARARHRGTRVLIEGCALQIAGLAALALVAFSVDAPSALLLALTMIVFGYGQGLVMAPLSGAVLSTVKPVAAGSASGIYGTTAQIGNAAGVAAIGAVFFAAEAVQSARAGFLVSLALFVTLIMICAAFLAWMRRASARS